MASVKSILSDYVLIVFIDEDWHCVPLGFTRKRFLLALSESFKNRGSVILCVQRPIDLVVAPFKYRSKMVRYIGGQGNFQTMNSNMHLLTPWMAAHERIAVRSARVVQVNKQLLRKQIDNTLDKLGLGSKKRLAWLFHPYQKDMREVVGEELLVYECYDEYAALIPPPERDRILKYENIVLSQADIVFTTAKKLYDARKSINPNTYLIQNGVDFELFAKAADSSLAVPPDVERIPAPRIGYAGAINGLLNFAMVNSIAQRHSEWHFVFLGPNNGNRAFQSSLAFREAQRRHNIHFLENKPYLSVPQYLKAFNVCIMPYLKNDCTSGLYPLKLNEYLAAGKPTVSTDFVTDLGELKDVIWITDTEEEFEKALLEAVKDRNPERIARGQQVARQNSWHARAERVCEILTSEIERRFGRKR
ncbi:MAG: glycosyltransferase [Candidatus Edwardsbacteria bacterium]